MMRDGTTIASVAALLGEPARASMLVRLLDGRPATASELAREADVSPQTASAHLGRLVDGGLLAVTRQGRYRFYRLSEPDVAAVVEGLLGLARRTDDRTPSPRGPAARRPDALRYARVCYDHLAGEVAVDLHDRLVAIDAIEEARGALRLSPSGLAVFAAFGIEIAPAARNRRPQCRRCLDWTERRPHLAGAAGAALLARLFELGWVRRERQGRALSVSPAGGMGLARLFRESPAG
jgi:DNA-binding transcriptional ArsR family regulator